MTELSGNGQVLFTLIVAFMTTGENQKYLFDVRYTLSSTPPAHSASHSGCRTRSNGLHCPYDAPP